MPRRTRCHRGPKVPPSTTRRTLAQVLIRVHSIITLTRAPAAAAVAPASQTAPPMVRQVSYRSLLRNLVAERETQHWIIGRGNTRILYAKGPLVPWHDSKWLCF